VSRKSNIIHFILAWALSGLYTFGFSFIVMYTFSLSIGLFIVSLFVWVFLFIMFMGITSESLKVMKDKLKKDKTEETTEIPPPVRKKPKYKDVCNNRG